MELTIVGAGVAGSALVREAELRGHRTKVLGGPPGASLAALSIVKASYVPDPDAKQAVEYALAAYRAAGCEVIEGANVTSNRAPEPKRELDWYAVQPATYLVRPQFNTIEVPPDWRDPDADWTIHATGASGLPGKVTFGSTWVNGDPRALRLEGLAVHRYAPYRSADAVRFKSGCRLGSSSSVTIDGARKEAGRIFDVAKERGWIGVTSGWAQIIARRVKREELTTVDPEARLATFGGFHRSGWSLAPLRAAQLLERLEVS